jgi:hypothetical protein
MKAHWRYSLIPACISFGPLLMSNMGGLETSGWVIPMMGTAMVIAGLSFMYSIISEQRTVIERLTNQNGEPLPTNT